MTERCADRRPQTADRRRFDARADPSVSLATSLAALCIILLRRSAEAQGHVHLRTLQGPTSSLIVTQSG